MAQTTSRKRLDARGASQYEQYDIDTAFTCSTSYASALEIDSLYIKDSVIIIKNDDASIGMDYQIFGTIEETPDFTDDDSDEWVNLISIAAGGTYDHTLATGVDATVRAVETLTNKYRHIMIWIKADSGTPTAKIWHRGEN